MARANLRDESWTGLGALLFVTTLIAGWCLAYFGYLSPEAEVQAQSRYRSATIDVSVPAGWTDVKRDVVLPDSYRSRVQDPTDFSNTLTIDVSPTTVEAAERADDDATDRGDAVIEGPTQVDHARDGVWWVIYTSRNMSTLGLYFEADGCAVEITATGDEGHDAAWKALDTLTVRDCVI